MSATQCDWSLIIRVRERGALSNNTDGDDGDLGRRATATLKDGSSLRHNLSCRVQTKVCCWAGSELPALAGLGSARR